jgi:hypothetical protein
VNPSPAHSNLLGLHHRETGLGWEFAGSQRISVSFMQSVIELLTRPGDIVLDWAVGDGLTFFARDLCNRFVVGFENRTEFTDLAERAIADVRRKAAPAVQGFTLSSGHAIDEPGAMGCLLSDAEGGGGRPPLNFLKDLQDLVPK